MDLSEKVVVITGGSGLLGSAFCRAVAEDNGIVIIADKNTVAADFLADEINNVKENHNAFACNLDINDISSIKSLIKFIHSKFGRIDALVNNAYPRNKNYGRKFFEVTYQDFCENINLNLGGYFLTSQQFSKYFLKQGHGNIINIASIYGVIAPRFEIYEGTSMTMPVEYAVIKSSLIHLTRYMSKYLKGRKSELTQLV